MDSIITYSLRTSVSSSDKYYTEISKFTEDVLYKINESAYSLIKDYQEYVIKSKHEAVRTTEEYGLEILTLGVLWKTYIRNAVVLGKIPQKLLVTLVGLRTKGNVVKITTDYIRGKLATGILLNKINCKDKIIKNTKDLDKLIKWLSAAGDFKDEVKRLDNWKEYFDNKVNSEVTANIETILKLAEWFESESRERLGSYTKNVDNFLKNSYGSHRGKEDIIYCGRKEVEYHLNMVGAEILNNVFRQEFLKTEEKMVLLPACMRYDGGRVCKAINTAKGYICANCTQGCGINKLTAIGKKYNFKVYIIPHESTAFSKEKVSYGKVGIIGVACVLNLISGGWKAKDIGFVPQCVLLEYSGCKKHWHKNGITTEINISKLINTFKDNNKMVGES
ncbi:MAG: DUF116 domain-containing protein [Bacillota bacterium]|nr:DUF116 domain-containing protein [Bacillota bacterium]